MQQASNLVNLNRVNSGTTPKTESDPQPDKVTSRLFAKFGLMYGHKWVSIYPDSDVLIEAEREWGRALAGLSLDDIKRALDRCIDLHPAWPPTVGEFKQLCAPDYADIGVPSQDQAWAQICREDSAYSHGVVLAARNDPRCDAYNWRLLPGDQGLKKFEPIYREYVRRVVDGEVFELPVMIENRVGKPATWAERKAHAANHLQSIRGALKS